MESRHEGWIASLSNGETIFEHEAQQGEISAWQQLLRYLKATGTRITMIRLQHGRETIVAVPNADGYVQCYQIHKSVFTGREHRFHGIGSVFGDKVFITWMNAMGEVLQGVEPLEKFHVHSTMDWQT